MRCRVCALLVMLANPRGGFPTEWAHERRTITHWSWFRQRAWEAGLEREERFWLHASHARRGAARELVARSGMGRVPACPG